MEGFPLEILARICRDLELKDILNLRCQNKQLLMKLSSELVWQDYVIERWFNIDLIEYSLERAQSEKDKYGSWFHLAKERYLSDLKLTKEIERISSSKNPGDRYMNLSLLDDIFTREHLYLPQLRRLQMHFDISFVRNIKVTTNKANTAHISGYLHEDWISHQRKRLSNLRTIYIASTIVKAIRLSHVLKAILYVYTDSSKFKHAEHFLLELSHGDPSFYELLPFRRKIIKKILKALSFDNTFTFPQLKAIVDRAILQETTLYEPINRDFKFESIQSSLIRYYAGEFSSVKPVCDSLLSYIIHLADLKVVSSNPGQPNILQRDEQATIEIKQVDSVDYKSDQVIDKVDVYCESYTKSLHLKEYLEFDSSRDVLLPNFGLKDNYKLVCDRQIIDGKPLLVYADLHIDSGQLRRYTKRQAVGLRITDLRSFEWVRKFAEIVYDVTSSSTSFISQATGFKGIPEDEVLSFMNYQKVFNNNLVFSGLSRVLDNFQDEMKNGMFGFLSYECEYSVKGLNLIPFYRPKNFIGFGESYFSRGQIVLQTRQNLQGIVIETEMAYVRLLMTDGSVYLSAAENVIAERLITIDLIYKFVECDELGFYFETFDLGQLRFV